MNYPTIFDYLPEHATAIWKTAAAEEALPKNPKTHALKTLGAGLLGMGVGTLAGYGGGALANKLYSYTTGKSIPASYLQVPASIAGAGLGLATSLYRAKEQEELRRAFQSHRNQSQRSST